MWNDDYNVSLKRSISGLCGKPSMIFVFSTFKQNLISQFFDLAIENPLGGGALAKLDYTCIKGRVDSTQVKLNGAKLSSRITSISTPGSKTGIIPTETA